MKTQSLISLSLAAMVAGAAYAAPSESGRTWPSAAPLPASAPAGVLPRGDCRAWEGQLASHILQALTGTDAGDVAAFLANPANRLALVQWHVLHQDNATEASGETSAQEGQQLPPRTFRELLTASPQAAAFLRKLMSDVEWMEWMAYSGECLHPGRAVAIMAALEARYPGYAADRVLRQVATATALEWARSGWDFEQAQQRALFFMRNYKAGRLNRGFAQLPFWQYRVICGSKGNNANGSLESLEWALDHVHLPADQYPGACWYCNYLSDNVFGDSIHGDYYYAPYDDVYGSNALQRSRDIGGVCGSLSHFGAFAAIANGIPALPAGEPGHCAYIVCVDGKWTPSYSLSWERGLHWQVWNGNHKYSSLHMATELYSPQQKESRALGNACRSLGALCASAGRREEALALFRESVKSQPLDYLAWTTYIHFLKAQMPDDAAAWKHLYKDISMRVAPEYPEMAAELLLGHVHVPLHRVCPASSDRMECYKVFWQSLKGMGPDRWAVENICGSQAGSLQDASCSELEAGLAFYTMALGYVAGNAAYAPILLAWGNTVSAKADEKMQQKFLQATLAAVNKGEGLNEGARDAVFNQAILGAERMRDRSSFQAIGRMLPQKYRTNRLPQWEAFPGKLVSQGGLLYTSSTCRHDWPSEHWGVLEPVGGRFHTDCQKDAWAVVELPRVARINGVVTISTSNNWRLAGLKVQYSESGKDDDWHEAGAMPNPTGQNVNRLDLQKSKPRARFIRVLRPGGPEVFQLNGIFVYGTPAA